MRILVATRNAGKLSELRRLFAGLDSVTLIGLDAFPDVPDVVEDADTFEGNAVKKACELAAATGLPALADDSGIEVDALAGAPGVYSARYGGDHDDEANNTKLLRELESVEDPLRTARFRCVLAFSEPSGAVHVATGVVEGSIAHEPSGKRGFAYDPLFVLSDGRTMAELSLAEKNMISHRAKAARCMRRWLVSYTGEAAE